MNVVLGLLALAQECLCRVVRLFGIAAQSTAEYLILPLYLSQSLLTLGFIYLR